MIVEPFRSNSWKYLPLVGDIRFVTNGVSYSVHVSIPPRVPEASGKGLASYLELVQVLRNRIGTDFLPVNHVGAVLCKVAHGAGSVSLVVTAVDLLGRQAQTRHHRLRRLEHRDDDEGLEGPTALRRV